MRTLCFAALVAFLLVPVVEAPAHAGPPPKDDAAAAMEHYKRGTTLYDLNRFDEAVKEYEAAYEIKDNPVLLYNIAQAYRLANKYPEALRFYRNYLRRFLAAYKKDPDNKNEVEQKIGDMEKLIAEQNRVATAAPDNTIAPGQKPTRTPVASPTVTATPQPAPTSPPPTPPAANNPPRSAPVVASNTTPSSSGNDGEEKPPARVPPPKKPVPAAATQSDEGTPSGGNPGRTKLIAGVVLAVVGLGAVGAGVAFGMMAKGAAADQERLAKDGAAFDPNLESKGKSNQVIGLALDAGGGALAAVGIGVAVWGALQKPEKARSSSTSSDDVKFVPAFGSNYAGGSLHLRF